MTETLKKMLAYQEVDMRLREIESECEQNEAFRLAAKSRQNLLSAKDRIAQCEKKSEEIMNAFLRVQAENNALNQKIEELKRDVEDSTIDDDVEYIIGVLKRTQESARNLERETEELQRQVAEITRAYNEARSLTKKSKETFDAKKTEYDRFYATKKEKIEELKAKLSSMAQSIDPELMTKYNVLRKEKKVPVVNLILKEGGSYRCPKCRMEVDAATVDKIRQAGIGECDTCRYLLHMD